MPNEVLNILSISGQNNEIMLFINSVKTSKSNFDATNICSNCNIYNAGHWKISQNIASIEYITAWNPETEYLMKISKHFPNLTFENKYAECGYLLVGYDIIKNGTCNEHVMYDWDYSKALIIRKEVGFESDTDDDDISV